MITFFLSHRKFLHNQSCLFLLFCSPCRTIVSHTENGISVLVLSRVSHLGTQAGDPSDPLTTTLRDLSLARLQSWISSCHSQLSPTPAPVEYDFSHHTLLSSLSLLFELSVTRAIHRLTLRQYYSKYKNHILL